MDHQEVGDDESTNDSESIGLHQLSAAAEEVSYQDSEVVTEQVPEESTIQKDQKESVVVSKPRGSKLEQAKKRVTELEVKLSASKSKVASLQVTGSKRQRDVASLEKEKHARWRASSPSSHSPSPPTSSWRRAWR